MELKGFDADNVKQIRDRLDLARMSGVTIVFAIESGSRAWGFPSPDSDYDCRFIYVRAARDHFSLTPMRDVIEYPIVGDIDAGGWDLRKALKLALGGNAVVNEWVRSPFVYEELDGFRAALKNVLAEILQPELVANHYVGLAFNQVKLVRPLDGEVKLKKLFYLLRPLLSLQWMGERDFAHLPPMDIRALMAECDLSDGLIAEIEKLIAVKSQTREMGSGSVASELADYLKSSLAHYDARKSARATRVEERVSVAQAFYSAWVMRLDDGA